MASGPLQVQGERPRRPRRDFSRMLARFLCLIFALIGAVPLSAGLLIRSEPAKAWAVGETTRLLRQQLGLEASFQVEMSVIPLRLAVTDLIVPATDGGSPAIHAELAAVSPRFFSLLAGRLDVGDIELENIFVRLTVEEGEITNLSYRLPKTSSESPELTRSPFRSLAITNATFELEIDGTHIVTEAIDIDAFAEAELSFDVAMRVSGADVDSFRLLEEEGVAVPSYDEDRLCALDVRLFLSKEEVVVRRLSLLGAVDSNSEEDTRPDCDSGSPERLAVRLSQVRIDGETKGAPQVRGHLLARLPLRLVDRFAPSMRGTGWVGFSGDIAMTGDSKLPEVSGQLTGAGMSLDGYVIAEELSAQVLISADVIQAPTLDARWGNGSAHLEGFKMEPFKEKMPVSIERLVTKDVDFPGVMRDVDVTPHSWVEWNFGDTVVTKVAGTISPFYLDGAVDAETRDFTVWDRGFDDPAKKYMVGIKKAHVKTRWRAHQKALEFYNGDLSFGESHLPIDLVRIGFAKTGLVVRLKEEGGTLDLADVSPVADVELAGKSHIYVNMEGPNLHPILKGTLSVDDLVVDGFPAGSIERSDLHFEPLFVEFGDLVGQKGAMDYFLPSARLDFGGPASVEFTSAVSSKNFVLEEFFSAFHFDEDPRFAGISGNGAVEGQVRYVLGGPSDSCNGGRLFVQGSAELAEAEVLDERFGEGHAQFYFDWFDIDAGTQGMRVDVPALSLRKGSGTLFGSAEIHPGGMIAGDFVGTQIPVSRVEALRDFMGHTDGFVTGMAQVGGTVDALSLTADVSVSAIKARSTTLGSSELRVKLIPTEAPAPPSSEQPKTGCGRPISAPYTQAEFDADESEGTFLISGEIFGKQIRLRDLAVSRQTNKVVHGKVQLHQLDVGALGALTLGAVAHNILPTGTVSGELEMRRLLVEDLYASDASLKLTEGRLSLEQLRVQLASPETRIRLAGGLIKTEGLALEAISETGRSGIVDAEVTIDQKNQIDATFNLRPTNLAVLAAASPAISRADGDLSARFSLKGPLASPTMSGFIEIAEGRLLLNGFSSPVSDLFVTVALDPAGLHVKKGQAKWGGGTVQLRGDVPFVAGEFGRTNLNIHARSVTLPLQDGITVGFDADLMLDVPPPSSESGELPHLSGQVDILSGVYKKPMRVTADISTLASRGEKTQVEGYDETKNSLGLDVLVRSTKPLRVENELVVAVLRIDPEGLRVTGTDQRFGAVGTVEVEQGGRILLRQNEFEVQRGLVRFNDPTRLHPQVDLTAVSEFRRYEDRGATQGGQGPLTATATPGGAPVAGNWRIVLHAYGEPDDLKVDLTSDPPLAQDDIFLLLTVGLTRTELDQTQSQGVGSSVALEALGSLSGAESAVTKTVPVDEFRFGSAYSPRSGRTEPTVTIGKRLSRRIRANVTTSLSDSSEVRSNVEYRATESLSVEGSYDNARDVASAAGGNLGGDVRWRLEFQ